MACPHELICLSFVSHFFSFALCCCVVPTGPRRGSLFKYDNTVSFWNFLAAGNYAARFYRFAMTDVAEMQKKLEDESVAAVASVEKIALAMLSGSGPGATVSLTELLTALTHDQVGGLATSSGVGWAGCSRLSLLFVSV